MAAVVCIAVTQLFVESLKCLTVDMSLYNSVNNAALPQKKCQRCKIRLYNSSYNSRITVCITVCGTVCAFLLYIKRHCHSMHGHNKSQTCSKDVAQGLPIVPHTHTHMHTYAHLHCDCQKGNAKHNHETKSSPRPKGRKFPGFSLCGSFPSSPLLPLPLSSPPLLLFK